MPSADSLHFVHAWLSEKTDFLRSALNRVGISFPPQKIRQHFTPYPLRRLDFPGLAFAASRIRKDVSIFRFSTQKLHTQAEFRLSMETILLALNLASFSVELRKR
jgi:hypothetical protein